MMIPAINPSVGLLWGFPETTGGLRLLFTTVELSQASRYGECLTDGRGHYELWEQWRTMSPRELKATGVPLEIKSQSYEHWPRGRIIYEIPPARFVLYADRRLHGLASIAMIVDAFCLQDQDLMVRGDDHYRT